METATITRLGAIGNGRMKIREAAEQWVREQWDGDRAVSGFEVQPQYHTLAAKFSLAHGIREYWIAWDDSERTYIITTRD